VICISCYMLTMFLWDEHVLLLSSDTFTERFPFDKREILISVIRNKNRQLYWEHTFSIKQKQNSFEWSNGFSGQYDHKYFIFSFEYFLIKFNRSLIRHTNHSNISCKEYLLCITNWNILFFLAMKFVTFVLKRKIQHFFSSVNDNLLPQMTCQFQS
jgi:hypothetical protein